MQRNRSSSKRAHSPAVVSEGPSPKIPQLDGSCFGKPVKPDAEANTNATGANPTPPPPKMPAFLRLKEDVIQGNYAKLIKLENDRLAASKANPDGEWGRLPADSTLDRYSNIQPWLNSRVKLQVPEGFNDYINASPISLVSTAEKTSELKASIRDKYICMQGPKRETVNHVWHMIWHELSVPFDSSPAVIIMLSPTHAPMPDDSSRLFEKCYQYYPTDETSAPLVINENNEICEDFKATVKFVSREPDVPGTCIEVRQLLMTVEGEEEGKPIWHYLYPNWPDFGALEEENVESILTLMRLTRERNGKGENPRVVHCSAGVGRTGTFVALEFLLGELQGGAWEGWDQGDKAGTDPIFDTVNQLRIQRKTMVQAFEQYSFLYEVLRKLWEEKYHIPCVGCDHKHVGTPEQPAQDFDGTNTSFDEEKGVKKNVCGYASDEA